MGKARKVTFNEIGSLNKEKSEAISKNNEDKKVKEKKPKEKSILKRKFFDPMTQGVRWTEKYNDKLEIFWNTIPEKISTFIATLAVFTFGATLKGEWVIILVTAFRHWTGAYNETGNDTANSNLTDVFSLERFKMSHWFSFWVGANVVSYGMYFVIGGFLHWYFYVRRRHLANEWKLQPKKWLSPKLELHEILVGSLALLVTGTYSATLACYIFNGNPSTIYYKYDEYGWAWFFLQFPVIFVYQDYTTYVLHRMYHTPFLYKHFHKLHHTYKQPTAFSVTAIHPVEIMHIQLTLCLPLFTVPVHWLPFYIIAIYTYYHGIIDHSGINFKAYWWQPWQPDAEFHDKHHEFFHVNFGFNIKIWDTLHGTTIRKNRIYNEETFHESVPKAIPTTENTKIDNNKTD